MNSPLAGKCSCHQSLRERLIKEPASQPQKGHCAATVIPCESPSMMTFLVVAVLSVLIADVKGDSTAAAGKRVESSAGGGSARIKSADHR